MRLRALLAMIVVFAVCAGVAEAKRAATTTEKAAIFKGLKSSLRTAEPKACWAYEVSTKDKTWAYVQIAPGKLGHGDCTFHGSDPGRHYLHEKSGKWKDVLSGTGFACSDFTKVHMPAKVIKELGDTTC
jgi:hypothetical protein